MVATYVTAAAAGPQFDEHRARDAKTSPHAHTVAMAKASISGTRLCDGASLIRPASSKVQTGAEVDMTRSLGLNQGTPNRTRFEEIRSWM